MSAKSMCDVSLHQGHEFILAMEKAGFDSNLIQAVINDPGNKKAKAMYTAVTKRNQTDNRFDLVKTFQITVSTDYNHATRLSTFGTPERRNEFYHYSADITDENFAKATTQLMPGRKFEVKVFKIIERVWSNECLAFLKSQKSVLTGAQGASLVYEQKKAKLPKGYRYISFDEKDALPFIAGYHRTPFITAYPNGNFEFNFGLFETDWDNDHCLLSFYDMPSGEAKSLYTW